MRRLLPRTLISQMILILLAGLVVSHLVAGWIHSSDRARVARAVGGFAAAQRIANLVRLINEAPDDWRPRIIAAMSDPRLRIAVTNEPPVIPPDESNAVDPPVRDYLGDLLPPELEERLRVIVTRAPPRPGVQPPRHLMERHAAAMPPHWRRMIVTVRLTDDRWLSLTMGVPEPAPAVTWAFVLAMGSMAVIVVLASIFAVRRVTAPLGIVTRAAQRLGRDMNAEPTPETGSLEMRQAAQAFNDMQRRLQAVLRNRTTMLAALSHDLRTPLTLLRLRTEGLPDSEDRNRMLASIDTLDAMVAATLAYARDTTSPEAWRRTDITALVGSIVDDMADAGMDVTLVSSVPIVLECQPHNLRRAITNLVENAVKYGTRARVGIARAATGARIAIDDDGPGIPDADLVHVFDPFFRLEQSRNRDTGGTGLGLAIARTIAEAHDGRIVLSNRPEGGLRATLELPSRAV